MFWRKKQDPTIRTVTLTVPVDAVVEVHLERGGAGGGADADNLVIHDADVPAIILVHLKDQQMHDWRGMLASKRNK